MYKLPFMNNYNDTNCVENVNNNDVTIDNNIDKPKYKDTNSDCFNKQSEGDFVTDIKTDILKKISKRTRYIDTHIRKTYYFDKKLFKKMEKLSKKYKIDNSYIINQALDLLFKTLEKK